MSDPYPSSSDDKSTSFSSFQHLAVYEGCHSRFFDTRLLLLLRLAALAFLIGHLCFFGLDQLLSITHYHVWTFFISTLSFFIAVFASLIYLINDEDNNRNSIEPNHSYHDDRIEHIEEEEESSSTIMPGIDMQQQLPSQQPSSSTLNNEQQQQQSRKEIITKKPLAKFLVTILNPIYQTTVSTSLYSLIVYWAFLRRSNVTTSQQVQYPDIVMGAAAPGLIIIDALLTQTTCYRFRNLILYFIVHAVYVTVYMLRGADQYLFLLQDEQTLSKSQWISRIVGLVVGIIITPFIVLAIAKGFYLVESMLNSNKSRTKRKSAWSGRVGKNESTVDDVDVEQGGGGEGDIPGRDDVQSYESDGEKLIDNSTSILQLPPAHFDGQPVEFENEIQPQRKERTPFWSTSVEEEETIHRLPPRVPSAIQNDSEMELGFCDLDLDHDENEDRESSEPISSRTSTCVGMVSESERWKKCRSTSLNARNTFTALVSSLSDSSLGGNSRGNNSNNSSSSKRVTSWTNADGLQVSVPVPKVEDEYFKMPAVLEAQGLERDVVKLNSLERNDSTGGRGGSGNANVVFMRRSCSANHGGDRENRNNIQSRHFTSVASMSALESGNARKHAHGYDNDKEGNTFGTL